MSTTCRQLNLAVQGLPSGVQLFVHVNDDASPPNEIPGVCVMLDRWVAQMPNEAATPPGNGLNMLFAAQGFKNFACRMPMPPDNTQIEGGVIIEMEPVSVPFPSRAEAIAVKVPFQGFYVNSHAFGAKYQAVYGGNGQVPFYGAALQDFWAAGDGLQVLDQLSDWSHVMLYCRPGGPGYNEDGQPYGNDQIIPAFDCWGNMGVYKGIADAIIERGQKPAYIVWGEGQEGYQWIKNNFVSWVQQMCEGYDRLRFGPVIIGFDGVWPASWSVDQMKEMIQWMRSVLGPDAFLGFFFAADYLWVEDENDYSKDWMDGLDIVFTSNGPDSAECPSLANKACYMVPSPTFSTCVPDHKGPFIFHDSSRGPRVWLEGEYATYQTVRDPNQTWKAFCETARLQSAALGCKGWG